MIKKKVKIPIYYGDLIIIKCNDWKEVNKKYKKKKKKTFEAIVFKYDTKKGYTKYVAAFSKKPTGATIAHEVTHLVNHIFIDRVMQLDPYNDEPQAYLTGWFFEQIDNFFKNKKAKK